MKYGQKLKLGDAHVTPRNIQEVQALKLGDVPEVPCNNPKFWKIEINGFIKIPNFGTNKNFYFQYNINFLSFKTCECEHFCFHASNDKNKRQVSNPIL
jgi:hypothetical protein